MSYQAFGLIILLKRFLIIVSADSCQTADGNEGMFVCFLDRFHDILELICVDIHQQQPMLLTGVSPFTGKLRNAVPACTEDSAADLIRMVGYDMQTGDLESLVQYVDDLGRYKLEDDGVQCLIPAEHQSCQKQYERIAVKNDIP